MVAFAAMSVVGVVLHGVVSVVGVCVGSISVGTYRFMFGTLFHCCAVVINPFFFNHAYFMALWATFVAYKTYNKPHAAQCS